MQFVVIFTRAFGQAQARLISSMIFQVLVQQLSLLSLPGGNPPLTTQPSESNLLNRPREKC